MDKNEILKCKEIKDLRTAQKEIYNILCITVDFFKEHNIKYYLCGGTLLGSIRHDGFIPWDDDIDILVPRDDYERLKEIFKTNRNIDDDIKAFLPSDNEHYYSFIKIKNMKYPILNDYLDDEYAIEYMDIDVFPLDHMPNNKILHYIFYARQRFFRCLYTSHIFKPSMTHYGVLLRLFYNLFYNIFGGYKNIAIKIDSMAKECNYKNTNSNYMGDGAHPNGMKDYFEIDIFDGERKQKFQDREFSIPVKAEKYLKTFYGDDYMTPPPVEKRVGHYKRFFRVGQ